MRWTLEILVFLVFAGMAAPVVWRMRGLSILRSALSREPPYMRVAVCAFFAAAVIYGGGKGDGGGNGGGDGGDGGGGDPPLRGGLPNQSPPQWFLDCGYDAADTDGDGIPDCWERWTGTDPRLADSGEDLDDDALTNLDEFMLQTDPQCADTDNDGLPDALEAAAAAAGFLFADPISPASFEASETDTDGDGIPDCWEGANAPLFPGVETNGFPVGVSVAQESEWNYDVLLSVTTSRHALLSWGDGYSSSAFVVPPCSGLALRLRLDAFATQTVTLTAIPGDQANLVPGAWRGGLTAEWDGRRGLPTDGNRIEPNSGVFVDKEGEEGVRAEFLGWSAGGLRSGGGAGTSSIDFLAKPWVMSLTDYVGCAIHDGGTTVELYEENVPPPYIWTCGDSQSGETAATSILVTASDLPGDNHVTVSVRQNDGIHSNLYPFASITTWLDHCNLGTTILLSVTDKTGFNVMTNHAPDIVRNPIFNWGNCPDGTNVFVYASWGGDSWERNFETIPTGLPSDDLTSHCIATNWAENLEINFEDYLPSLLMPYKDELSYRVNGMDIDGTALEVGESEPDDLFPEIYFVEMCNEYGATLDRIWINVLSPKTSAEFDTWVSNNATNAAWLVQLPKPPDRILVDNQGHVTLPSAASANWNVSDSFPTNSYMHPKAVYELRSNAISGGHGHQATYDADGNIITGSIKAGTADYASPSSRYRPLRIWDHKEKDVEPYIRALQLDGNPVVPVDKSGNKSSFWTRNLSRPPLRVGPFTQQYLDRRPTTPTGVLNIP